MHAHPSARGPPGGEAPGKVGVHERPDRLPSMPPRKATHGSRAPEEVSSEPEEGGPVLARRHRHPPATLLRRVPQVWTVQTEVVGSGSERTELTGLRCPEELRVNRWGERRAPS
eukprot:3598562-Alexandrium_andersonii.AAC.1